MCLCNVAATCTVSPMAALCMCSVTDNLINMNPRKSIVHPPASELLPGCSEEPQPPASPLHICNPLQHSYHLTRGRQTSNLYTSIHVIQLTSTPSWPIPID